MPLDIELVDCQGQSHWMQNVEYALEQLARGRALSVTIMGESLTLILRADGSFRMRHYPTRA